MNNPFYILPSSQLIPVLTTTVPDRFLVEEQTMEEIRFAVQGLQHYMTGNLSEAVACYSEAIEQFPTLPFFFACRSIVNEELGDSEGAFYDYQVAKKIDFNYHIFLEWVENKPAFATGDSTIFSDLKSLLDAALHSVQQFDYAHGLALYSDAVVRFPAEVQVLVYRGALYMRLLQYDLALMDFNAAIDRDATLFQAFVSRAKLYVAIREHDLALKDFGVAVALDPENSLVYEERGNFLMEIGAYERAVADFDKLTMLLPEDFYVFALRADLYEKMEAWTEALADYDRAITFNPYYADLYAYRADIKDRLGDQNGAEEDRQRFAAIENDED